MKTPLAMTRLCLLMLLVACESLGADQAPQFVPLTVAIVPPISNAHGKAIDFPKPDSHFDVVLHNISTHQLTLWRDWCSLGYYCLTFEVMDDDGKVRVVTKKTRGWDKDFPDPYAIAPNGFLVIEVAFAAPDVWNNAPDAAGERHGKNVKLRAIYTVPPSNDADREHAWQGSVASDWESVTLWP